MRLGLLLFALGLVLLLKNLGILQIAGSFWGVLGPVILIVLGLYIMMLVQKGRQYRHWLLSKYWKSRDDEM
jgi:uncharacterized membrane protein YesL